MRFWAGIMAVCVVLIAFPSLARSDESLIQRSALEEMEFRKAIFRMEVKISVKDMVRGGLSKEGLATGVIVGRADKDDKSYFYIVSAAHIVGEHDKLIGDVELKVGFPEKGAGFPITQDVYPAKFLFGSWGLEYALMLAEVPKADLEKLDISVAAFSKKVPQLLENFWVSGYLGGDFPVVNKAYLSRMVADEQNIVGGTPMAIKLDLYLIASGLNGPGMSGGGVFDSEGALTGIVWAVSGEDHVVSATPAMLIAAHIAAKMAALKNEGKEEEKK